MTDIRQGDERIAYFNYAGASFSIIGDYDTAINNLHVARGMLLQIDLVNPDYITHSAINKTLDDGTYIECRRVDGDKSVTIITPGEEIPVEEIKEELEEEEVKIEDDKIIPLIRLYSDYEMLDVLGWAVFYNGNLDPESVAFLEWDWVNEPDPHFPLSIDIGVNLEELASLLASRRGFESGACTNLPVAHSSNTVVLGVNSDEEATNVPWDYPPLSEMLSGEEYILQSEFDAAHSDRTNCTASPGPPSYAHIDTFNWRRTENKSLIHRYLYIDNGINGVVYKDDIANYGTWFIGEYENFHMLYDDSEYNADEIGSQILTDSEHPYYDPEYLFDWNTFGTSSYREGYSNDTTKESSLVGAFYDFKKGVEKYECPLLPDQWWVGYAKSINDGTFWTCFKPYQSISGTLEQRYRMDWICDRSDFYWGYLRTVVSVSEGVIPCASMGVDTWPVLNYINTYKMNLMIERDGEQQEVKLDFEIIDDESTTNYSHIITDIRWADKFENATFFSDRTNNNTSNGIERPFAIDFGGVGITLQQIDCSNFGSFWWPTTHGAIVFHIEEESFEIEEESFEIGVNPSVWTFEVPEEAFYAQQKTYSNHPFFSNITIDKKEYWFKFGYHGRILETGGTKDPYPEGVNDFAGPSDDRYKGERDSVERFVVRFTGKNT